MSPVSTPTLGKQAREALQRVRKEIRAAEEQFEKRVKELREEEAKIQAVLDTLTGRAPASGAATQAASTRTRRRRTSARRTTAKSNGASSRAASSSKTSQSKAPASTGGGVPAAERHKKMIELLSKSELTREELAEALGVSKVRVGQLMEDLVKEKKVVSRQDPRAARPRKLWRVAGTKETVKA